MTKTRFYSSNRVSKIKPSYYGAEACLNLERKSPLGHSRHIWTGVLILLLAAVLRLAGFEESPIGGDQSVILAAAFDIASLRGFPLVGIKSSVGILQTPVTSYLAAVPLFIIPRVIAIKWFFSVLDLLAIGWLYQAVRRTFGPVAAMVSAVLYATNPWIVEFVRWIWYQTLIPTFATISFSVLLLLATSGIRKRGLYPALGLLSATLMGTVHLAAFPWAGLLVLGVALLTWRGMRHNRANLVLGILIGATGSLLLIFPYLRFLVSTSFADLISLLSTRTTWGLNVMALRLSSELLTGREVLSAPRSPLWGESIIRIPLAYDLVLILLVLAVLGTVWRTVQKPKERLPLALTLGWTLLAPLLFLFSSGVHLQHFYLLALFPAPFVLMGLWAQEPFPFSGKRAAQVASRIVGSLVTVLLILLAAWWASLWGVRIRLEQEGLLGAPTRAWLMDRATEQIRHYLAKNPTCQVIIISYFDGDGSPFEWIRSAVQSDQVRAVQAGQGLIIPASCTCYMLGPSASHEDLAPIAEQVVEQQHMSTPAHIPWRFACISAMPEPAVPLAEWRNGLSLLKAEFEEPRAGGQIHVTYIWHYREVSPRAYHFFTHLLRDGVLVTQSDGPYVPSRYWRNGDLLVTRFTLQLPDTLDSGKYRMLVGVYGWPDLERVSLTNGGDTFEVGHWVVP